MKANNTKHPSTLSDTEINVFVLINLKSPGSAANPACWAEEVLLLFPSDVDLSAERVRT